jgi:holo-[acyl-carrier protein] synthase
MILGTGIDLAEVHRIRESIERFGDRFLHRVFTPGEIAYSASKANKYERYAARFAAKEAAMKALGSGWARGVTWHDFEVVHEPGGRPQMLLHARAAEIATEMGIRRLALSLTHTERYGLASVIAED